MNWKLQLLTMELRRKFSYRVDFWVTFFVNSIISIGALWYLWVAMYESETSGKIIGGYSFPQMMLYSTFSVLMMRALGMESNLGDEIYSGGLNKYLIYPVSLAEYKFYVLLARVILMLFQGGVGVVAYIFIMGHEGFSDLKAWQILCGVLGYGMAMILYGFLGMLLETVAFWADQIWSLLVALRFLVMFLGGASVPLSLFPDWSQAVLRWLPFDLMVSFPTLCFMGRIGVEDALFAFAKGVVWFGVIFYAWKALFEKGSRDYAGVGI